MTKTTQGLAGLCILVFFLSCKQTNPDEFTVSGMVKNTAAKTVYLEEGSLTNLQPVIIDSAKLSKDGSFRLTGTGKEESIYILQLDNEPNPFATLVNDTKHITVTADLTDAANPYSVKGSPATAQLHDYLKSAMQKAQAIYTLNLQADSLSNTGATDSALNVLKTQQAGLAAAFRNETINTVNNSNSAALPVFIIGLYQSIASNPAFGAEPLSDSEMKDIVNLTAAKFPNHQGIANVKRNLGQPKPQTSSQTTTTAIWVNKPAPDFTLPAMTGAPVSLSSLRGKYVLVDFWASWCRPCRMENPNVVKAYQKFKDKNFTVLGVSLDQEKKDWLEAIKKDSLTWTHVSDLKFWSSAVVPLYNIEGIPYNVLVDPNGKIIGESLRGEDLERKLQEVLK